LQKEWGYVTILLGGAAMIKKRELEPEVRDTKGTIYWSPEKAMIYLGVRESTLRHRTKHLTRYHPSVDKRAVYFKKDDIEGLVNAPLTMIPEVPEEGRPALVFA
jgi:hypothetical protein